MGCLTRTNLVLFSADATFSLQTIPSVAEGSNFVVMVELATPFGMGTLDCAVVVTLVTTPGSAVGKHNKHYM